jgi:hypothetical protein
MKSLGGSVAKPQKPKPPDDPEQSKRFEDAARELGVDETGSAFRRALDAAVPKKRTPKSTKPRK